MKKKDSYLLLYVFIICFSFASCSKENNDVFVPDNSNQNTSVRQKVAPLGYSLVFEDNFDTFKTSNWSVGMKDSNSGDKIPGAIGDYLLNSSYNAYVTTQDSYVSGGSLYLRNQKRSYTGTSPAGNYQYTTGWINSMHKVYLNKGYIEVRAKFPTGDKVWPAIWLLSEDLIWGPEWDLWEYWGYRSGLGYDNMGMHLFYGTYPNGTWSSGWLSNFNTNYNCTVYHVYGFEWTNTYAKWYIDGSVVRTLTNTIGTNWPNENMYLVINNSTQTSAPDVTTTYPNSLVIDYIRIYQKPTPVSLTNGGFETGSVSPWSTYGTCSVTTTNTHSGTYCALISQNNSGFEYTITGLIPNKSYTFSGYIKSGSSLQNVNICAKNFGGTQVTSSTMSTSYTLKAVTFTTGSTNTTATLSFYKYQNGTSAAYGDDFAIVAN